ncbi:MAG: hypothetical protein RLZZ59_256 [Pseudomonadota bacterium]
MYNITWTLVVIFYAFQMSMRIIPMQLLDYAVRELHFSTADIGILTSIYYFGYALAHIPIGILLDRFNPKYTLISSILICLIGLYALELTNSTFTIFLGRFLVGFGSAGGILGAVKVIYDFYPRNYSIMLGITILIGVVGSYYSELPMENMLVGLSYEQGIQGLILFGMLLSASILAFYTNKKTPPQLLEMPITNTLISIISNKKLILVSIYSGLMIGPLEGFASIWGRNFLVQIYGMSALDATQNISLILIGLGIGCVIYGYLYPKVQNVPKSIAYVGILMLLSMIMLINYPIEYSSLTYIICFVIGICCAYQIFSFAMISKFIPTKTIALSTAILNMIIMSFGFVYHNLIGFILSTFFISDSFSSSIYSHDAYKAAFAPVLIGIAIGTFGFSRLKIK